MAPVGELLPTLKGKISSDHATDTASYRGGPQIAGIDLVAMLVSDSGLANTEPVWWNTSPVGCLLIGLQPRGGWQVLQRTVQWGSDRVTKAFGVPCTRPTLYAYFACSIRNRIEVWDSPRWTSPMQDAVQETSGWKKTEYSTLSRPTKLLDGSRGGQAFMAEVLRPADLQHYGIEQQARMQFLSILLVAVGLLNDQLSPNLEQAFEEDFGLTTKLSVVFRRLFRGLVVCQLAVLCCAVSAFVHLYQVDLFGAGDAYMIELTSIACWATGAIGLLMHGGNPRVQLVQKKLSAHVLTRLDDLEQEAAGQSVTLKPVVKVDEKTQTVEQVRSVEGHLITVRFGSQHGSVFLQDMGECYMSIEVLRKICQLDIEFSRPWTWYASVMWCSAFLILSITLQVVGVQTSTVGSEVAGIAILLTTSVLRGSGISGPEEWMIPSWKRRKGAAYGVALQGFLRSR